MKKALFLLGIIVSLFFASCGTQGGDKSDSTQGTSDVEAIGEEVADSVSVEIEKARTELEQKMEEVDAALNELE
ncbi:hypothetical protein [Marinilabilia salmonicolor]|uniref:hypothetical protein n=1 Tax=Marinilabilia salmonicolor TaxID=989 RepID=UPI00029A8E9E|nr:hypothetical protein [Marinilabilia salmonicolor]